MVLNPALQLLQLDGYHSNPDDSIDCCPTTFGLEVGS